MQTKRAGPEPKHPHVETLISCLNPFLESAPCGNVTTPDLGEEKNKETLLAVGFAGQPHTELPVSISRIFFASRSG